MSLPPFDSIPRVVDRVPLGPERVRQVLYDLYGLRGTLEELGRERDHVYRLTCANQSYVIRVSPPTEPFASLRLQTDALHAIAAADATLPVPRVRMSARGRDIEEIESRAETIRVRVLTHLPGKPILSGPRSRAQLVAIGQTLARLDRALADATIDAVSFPLLWDLRASPQLRPLARFIEQDQRRHLVDAVLAEFETEGLSRLVELPDQLIHNDFNPKNILFDGAAGAIVGIIDFGDVVHAPRVVDIGVTIARHAECEAPLQAGESIVAGYCSIEPMTPAEIGCLYVVARTRLAMRAIIGSWRLHHNHPSGDASQIDHALSLLERLTEIGSAKALGYWREAAGI